MKVLKKGNPQKIETVSDFSRPGIRIVNRPLGTGTRLLLDQEMQKADVRVDMIDVLLISFCRYMLFWYDCFFVSN